MKDNIIFMEVKGLEIYNNGQLQIDKEKGTIWFNDENGECKLRICKIPKELLEKSKFIDLNWEFLHKF